MTCVSRILDEGGEGPLLQLAHQLLQGHGLPHVALDLQLPGHESGRRLQLAREHLAKVSRAQGEPRADKRVRLNVSKQANVSASSSLFQTLFRHFWGFEILKTRKVRKGVRKKRESKSYRSGSKGRNENRHIR